MYGFARFRILRPQLRSAQVHPVAHVGEGEHITRMDGANGPIPKPGTGKRHEQNFCCVSCSLRRRGGLSILLAAAAAATTTTTPPPPPPTPPPPSAANIATTTTTAATTRKRNGNTSATHNSNGDTMSQIH